MNNCQKISKVNIYLLLFFLVPCLLISYQVFNNNYLQFDNQILQVIPETRNVIFNILFIAIYQISGVYITGFIVLIALAVLIYKRYWNEAKTLAFATLGILILVDEILKPFFDRRRPPQPRLVRDLSQESFPSGHAAGNLVLYFYLSFILAIRYPKYAKYIYSLATIIVLLIGFSSIYTNAHWTTDIVAGYIFGYLWLLVSLTIFSSNSKAIDKRK